jgi:hypothetical protein
LPGLRVADDLVQRDLRPTAANVLWVADITYLRTWEGWLYLVAVQDACSRRIVGWSMADHMRTDPVVEALNMAVARSTRDIDAVFEPKNVIYERRPRSPSSMDCHRGGSTTRSRAFSPATTQRRRWCSRCQGFADVPRRRGCCCR